MTASTQAAPPEPLWHLATWRIDANDPDAVRMVDILETYWVLRAWDLLGLRHGIPKLAVRGDGGDGELICHIYGEPLESIPT
jgi:hypothetical protein